MEEAEVELDNLGQFRLLGFMAEEMGEADLRSLFMRLLDNSGAGAPLDLLMPAPNPERVAAAIAHHLSTFESEAKIPGDRLRALRLAAAYSLLPDAYKRGLAYTINQPKAIAPARRDSKLEYVIRVPREPLSPKPGSTRTPAALPSDPESWPWLEACVELASKGEDTVLTDLLDWLSRLFPEGFLVSRKAIDAGYVFWNDYVRECSAARTGMPPLSGFEGLKVDISVLLAPTLPLLKVWNLEMRRDYLRQLCSVADASGLELPHAVFDELLACFSNSRAADDRTPLDFYSGLPRSVLAQVWTQSYRRRILPGWMEPRGGQTIEAINVRFALVNFDPGLVASGEIADGIQRQIRDSLARLADRARHDYYAGGFVPARELERRGLEILMTMDEVNPTLLRCLIEHYQRGFVREPMLGHWFAPDPEGQSFESQQLTQLLQKTIPKFGAVGAPAMVQLLEGIRLRNHADVKNALFGLRLDSGTLPNLIQMLRMLDGGLVGTTPGAESTRQAVRLVWELAATLRDPARLESYQSPAMEVPVFEEWQSNRRVRIAAFVQTLESAFKSRSHGPEVVLAVGSTYVRVSPIGHYGLFEAIYNVLDRDANVISTWLEASPERAPRSRGVFMARLLNAASARGNNDAETCWNKIEAVLRRLRPESQDEMRRQLENSVAGQVPRFIMNRVESKWTGEREVNRSRW